MKPTTQQTIAELFTGYIRSFSKSGTADENLAAAFARDFFAGLPYFQAHPEYRGSYAIERDPFQRTVEWALVRGSGQKTVVLIHHFDVVEIDDYGALKPLAFNPAALEQALRASPAVLSPEAHADLLSGQYIFGRGTADMKGGGVIQMALLKEFSEQADFQGNVLLVAVPDEENLSAGARSAVALMAELKARFALEYVMMLNSEPQLHKQGSTGVFTAGSIGKIMPFVYVRGVLSHAGLSQDGFNPLGILSDVIRRTEFNLDFTETHPVTGEMSPLPTWLMAHDSKTIYDVSMPLSAFGMFNVLMFANRTGAVLRALRELCAGAAQDFTAQANQAAAVFYRTNRRSAPPRTWQTSVLAYDDFLARQRAARGAGFEAEYRALLADAAEAVNQGRRTSAAATWDMLDRLTQLDGSNQPLVLVGLIPPFYPSVCYLDRPDYRAQVESLYAMLNGLSHQRWGQDYQLDAYIMGVSDLSFSSLSMPPAEAEEIGANMPLFGSTFDIPFRQLAEISMPCINIGPLGRDVHKLSERIFQEDLLERTPVLLRAAILQLLS